MKRIFTLILLLLTVAWGAFIFSNSLDSGKESSEKSGAVHKVVNDVAQSLGVTEEISEATVRTSAHFGEFAVFALLLCVDVIRLLPLSPKEALSRRHLFLLLPLPCSMLVAIIDESLQLFSPGRGMQGIDMLVDSTGALCGMLFFGAIFFPIHVFVRLKHRKNNAT